MSVELDPDQIIRGALKLTSRAITMAIHEERKGCRSVVTKDRFCTSDKVLVCGQKIRCNPLWLIAKKRTSYASKEPLKDLLKSIQIQD